MNNTDNKLKKVIYTCIINNYDELKQPEYIDTDFTYFCFTNSEKLLDEKKIGVWNILPLCFDGLDNTRNCRWHKIHFYKLFPESEEVIWIDGKVQILTDKLFKLIQQKKDNIDIIIPKHHANYCLYREADICKYLKLDYAFTIDKQIALYKEQGFPENYGLNETSILYRKNTQLCKKIMQEWWFFIEHYSLRDQLSLSYVLWKNNIDIPSISIESLYLDETCSFYSKHNKFIISEEETRKLYDEFKKLIHEHEELIHEHEKLVHENYELKKNICVLTNRIKNLKK